MKLFITGVFRTGTTLLTQMLRQSNEISLTYDALNFMRFGWQRYGKDGLTLDAAKQLGKDFYQRLNDREIVQGFDLEKYTKEVEALENIRYADVYDIIMRMYVGNEHWGEKTVLEWRNASSVINMFDDMYVLHVVRDPRDVLVSWKKYTNAPGVDYLDVIGNNFDSMQHAQVNQKKYPQKYYVVRYEDLIAHPEEEMKKICAHIGMTYTKEMLDVDRFKKKIEEQGAWTTNSSFTQSMQGISNESIERWKEHMSREELYLCEHILGESMEQYTYKRSDTVWTFRDAYNAFALLQQSPLAYGGVLNIIHNNEGVERYPTNPLDSATWDTQTAKY